MRTSRHGESGNYVESWNGTIGKETKKLPYRQRLNDRPNLYKHNRKSLSSYRHKTFWKLEEDQNTKEEKIVEELHRRRKTNLHETINKVIDKVAPWVTIMVSPNYLGKYMTKDL